MYIKFFNISTEILNHYTKIRVVPSAGIYLFFLMESQSVNATCMLHNRFLGIN